MSAKDTDSKDNNVTLDKSSINEIESACDELITISDKNSAQEQRKLTQANKLEEHYLNLAKETFSSWSELYGRIFQ